MMSGMDGTLATIKNRAFKGAAWLGSLNQQ